MVNKKDRECLKGGLRILAKIIARDIYGKWRGGIERDSNKNKLDKVKEKVKS